MLNKSICQTLMISLMALLFIPILFIAPSLFKELESSHYANNLKSHESLSLNISHRLNRYFNEQKDGVKFLDTKFQKEQFDEKSINAIANDYLSLNKEITALSFFMVDNERTKTLINTTFNKKTSLLEYAASEKKYRLYNKKNTISSVYKSANSQKPAVLITHHILNKYEEKIGTILMEMDLSFVNEICAGMTFGIQTHCSIVDNKNVLLSHFNKTWSNGVKQSNSSILTKSKNFAQGSMSFLSNNDTKILAGYSKVEGLNWRVLVTQPESAISTHITDFKSSIVMWSLIGLLFSLFIGILIVYKVTRPIQSLVSKTKKLSHNKDSYLLGNVPKRACKDIASIWKEIDDLVSTYHDINREVCLLSRTSNTDIRKLVAELRNKKLNEPKNIDTETGISNQQAFISELQKCLHINKDKNIGLITFKIDNYSQVLKQKGQQAAANFMSQIASILNENLRLGDMIMRHKDDNYFSVYIDNNDENALIGSAGKLRNLIETSVITWRGELLSSKVSTELLFKKVDHGDNAEKLISQIHA